MLRIVRQSHYLDELAVFQDPDLYPDENTMKQLTKILIDHKQKKYDILFPVVFYQGCFVDRPLEFINKLGAIALQDKLLESAIDGTLVVSYDELGNRLQNTTT